MSIFSAIRCKMCGKILWPWKKDMWVTCNDSREFGPFCIDCAAKEFTEMAKRLKWKCLWLAGQLEEMCKNIGSDYCKNKCCIKDNCIKKSIKMGWLIEAEIQSKRRFGDKQ